MIYKREFNGIIDYHDQCNNYNNPHGPAYKSETEKRYYIGNGQHNIVGPAKIQKHYVVYTINGKRVIRGILRGIIHD